MKKLFLILFSFISFISCNQKHEISGNKIVFGSYFSILFEYNGKKSDGNELLASIFTSVDELYNEIDVVSQDSAINKILATEIPTLEGVRAQLFLYSMDLAQKSLGAIDPTLAPLVKLWGIGMGSEGVPSLSEIERVLNSVGYEKIRYLHEDDKIKITKKPQNMGLDFGAFGKGLAGQIVKEKLLAAGVSNGLINVGGNIVTIGEHWSGRKWKVGVQDPTKGQGEYFGALALSGQSVSTSGSYERYFEQDGKRYHHILSGKTGYPVETNLLGVTVISDNALEADAFSTLLFALPKERAWEWVLDTDNNCDAIFCYSDGSFWATQDAIKIFTPKEEGLEVRLIERGWDESRF